MTTFKQYVYILIAAIGWLCAATSCSDEVMDMERPFVRYNADGSMNIAVSLEIPTMPTATTRAMDATPNYTELGLWLLVFETNSGNLLQVYRVPEETVKEVCGAHTGNNLVEFTAKLNPTDAEATIHLIATDQPDMADQLSRIGHENLLGTLRTTDDHEAYWARIPLDREILPSVEEPTTKEQENYDAIAAMLTHVIMLRNFGKISMVVGDGVSFTIDEMYLYNYSDCGSMTPYHDDADEPFVTFFEQTPSGVKAYTYADMKQKGYIGIMPAGTSITEGPKEWKRATATTDAEIYFYEQPFRAKNRAYVIIGGHRANGQTRYYKMDIGQKDDTSDYGEYVYYNLLRNFDYHITIIGVEDDGYGTLEEARNGIVSNNIDAAIELRNLTTLSDGNDIIRVNFINHVFTINNRNITVDLMGQYLEGLDDHTDQLRIKYESDGFLDITEQGMQDGWKTWHIAVKENANPADAGGVMQQTVVIYRGKKEDGTFGLYRIITFTLIDHFDMGRVDTYPGLWNDFESVPWDWSDHYREIGQDVNSPLTLFFELPQGLPESVFPLEFTIESNKQNIQNAYQGNAVVKTVPASQSLFFHDSRENVATARMQFVKTVTWLEYSTFSEDEANAGNNYIVRCRFLTTTDLAQDGIGDVDEDEGGRASTTILKVANLYFATKEDGFTRQSNTSDPTPQVWDFAESSATDGLIVNGSFTHSTDGYYTGNGTFEIKEYSYPASIERTARLIVTATDNAGRPLTKTIAVQAKAGSDSNQMTSTETTRVDDGSSNQQMFDIKVPATSETKLTVTITADTDIRFYKIEFYPRGTDDISAAP
ncbi:MAG: hypothetical protein J1F25_07705 [Prevotellaceae bacterium]|nr:hypothetical protein [Prevotellaceae bacterium]